MPNRQVRSAHLLNTSVFEENIQKDDITKNKRETKKNIFRKKSGCLVDALCRSVSFWMMTVAFYQFAFQISENRFARKNNTIPLTAYQS
jgi:hypothetical protein